MRLALLLAVMLATLLWCLEASPVVKSALCMSLLVALDLGLWAVDKSPCSIWLPELSPSSQEQCKAEASETTR
jgi:hypothetical protein